MANSKDTSISISTEDYLKTIWLVAQEGIASTNTLAEQLQENFTSHHSIDT